MRDDWSKYGIKRLWKMLYKNATNRFPTKIALPLLFTLRDIAPLFPTLWICIFHLLLFSSFKGRRFIRRTISDSFAGISLSFSRRRIRGRNETEASNSRLSSRAQPNELSAFFARALHSFLDCICPLLDIPFYWTEPRSFPSFLPSHLHSFALPSIDYTRDTSLPSCRILSIPSLPQLSPFPPSTFVRNACLSFLTTRLSSATSFYSASRISNVIIHPSANPFANLRSFVVEYFRLDTRPKIILLFLLPFDFRGVMWNYVDSASRKRTRVVETRMGRQR